jgi:hypothetical protein
MTTASTLVRATIFALAVSAVALAQQQNQTTKLFPSSAQPKSDSATLISAEKRVGDIEYQIFYHRNRPGREVFRVDIGFYYQKQLTKDWNYGLIQEKDMNGDGIPDYVWYGWDETGQRLLWFLSEGHKYKCVDVFRSAEEAWSRRIVRAGLRPYFEELQLEEVTWDGNAQLLTVQMANNHRYTKTTQRVKLTIAPAHFVNATNLMEIEILVRQPLC